MPRKTAVAVEPAAAAGSRAEQIMSVAARLFHERGYGSVSIRDIGAAAGISSSTLYHHFQDKQEILFAITERFELDLNKAMFDVAAAVPTPAARLRALVVAQIRFEVGRRTDLLTGNHFRLALNDRQRTRVIKLWRLYRDLVRDTIAEGVEAGELRVSDPDLATGIILDMNNGIREWFSERGKYTLEALAEFYGDAALRICNATAPASSLNGHRRSSGRKR